MRWVGLFPAEVECGCVLSGVGLGFTSERAGVSGRGDGRGLCVQHQKQPLGLRDGDGRFSMEYLFVLNKTLEHLK